MDTPKFPITRTLSTVTLLSFTVAVLMAAASLAGLLFQASIYPSEELRRAFVSNDVVNLFLGLPILLGSLWLARKGRLIGLLFWPGALLYVTYNFIAYAAAMPFSLSFTLYLALVILSMYSIYVLLSSMDAAAVRERLKGKVAERFGGGVLAGFGILFCIMRIGVLVKALSGEGLKAG